MPILTITVVLRTVQIAKSRISFFQVLSVSLKAAPKGSQRSLGAEHEMTGMLMEISLNDLYVDPRSRAKCLFVKQIRKNTYNFVFNVNNLPFGSTIEKDLF